MTSQFPSAEWLQKCQRVDPDFVSRTLAMAEREQRFRHLRTWLGQVFGFAIALAFLGAATYLIASGMAVSGTILGTVDLVALVTVFVVVDRARGGSAVEPPQEIQAEST